MAVSGQEVRQLLLQVDASVALAQRNLNSLAQQVDRDTARMEGSLGKPERAIRNLERAFSGFDQVLIASSNQQRAYGMVVDQVTAKELQMAQAIGNVARAMNNLSGPVQIATRQQLEAAAAIGAFATQSGRLEGVGRRAVVSMGQYRAGAQQLGFQIGDVAQQMALGIRPMTIFAQQSGQVIQAITMMQGSSSAFMRFLGGPWGAVITGAATVLAALAFGHRSAAEDANKHETAEQTLMRAIRGQADAVAALSRVLRELREESERSLETDTRRAAALNFLARQALATAQAERTRLAVRLEEARQDVEDAARRASDPTLAGEGGFNPALADPAGGRFNDLQQRLAQLDRQIADAQRIIGATTVQGARALSTAAGRINAQFDDRRAALERSYAPRIGAAGNNDAARAQLARELQAAEARLEAERQAALRTVSENERAERQLNDTRGRAISLTEARSIAEGAGGHVSSTVRSRETQARLYRDYLAGRGPLAAPPGHSAHERGEAIDIVGLSLAQVRRAFRGRVAPGRIIEEINPRTQARHVHVPLSGHGAEREANSEAERLERARLERARNDAAFAQDLARANEELLQVRNELNVSTEAQADLQLQQLELERARLVATIESEVTQGRYTRAQADQLLALNEQIATQRAQNIRARREDQLAQERVAMTQENLRGEQELESLRGRMTETRNAQRESALRQLDISYQIERAELDRLISSQIIAESQRKQARLARDRLDERYQLERQGLEREHESPGARYLRDIRRGRAEMSDAVEDIEVRALQTLNDELAETVVRFLDLGGVAGRVLNQILGDLIRIAIQTQLINPIAQRLFGGASSISAPGLGGSKGAGIAAAAELLSGLFGSFGGGKAGGGSVQPGKWYMTGERGPEPFIPKVPGTIIPNHMLGRGGGGRQQVDVRVSLDNEMLRAEVVKTSMGVVGQAIPHIEHRAASKAVATLMRPPLP